MHQTCRLMARIAHRIPLLRTDRLAAGDLRGKGRQQRCWRAATSDYAVVRFAGEKICVPYSAAVVPSPEGFADLRLQPERACFQWPLVRSIVRARCMPGDPMRTINMISFSDGLGCQALLLVRRGCW